MIDKKLHLVAYAALSGITAATSVSAWTVAMDNFDSYEDGVAIRDQIEHGGVGFDGDWIETLANEFWTPLAGTTTDKLFDGTVIQDGYGLISNGGRHMRALTHPQTTGVVYASVLMMNIGGTTGSSQFHINSDTPIKDGEGNVTIGAADLIGGVRYGDGVIQIIDTSVLHVPDNPDTPENESRNLDALIPGEDGLDDSDPELIAYNEYYTLAETYVDLSDRSTLIDTDILWVIKYDITNRTMSYYAYFPGDPFTVDGASYSVIDHPVAAGRDLPLGTISIAAWRSGVIYEHVKVGTTLEDVIPVYNMKASAPMVRAPIVVDGTIEKAWDSIPAQSYGLKHGDGSQPASATDASGTWKAAWDTGHLYLLFKLTDDEHFEGTDGREDQIEFWTDTNLARNNTNSGGPPAYDNTDTQWVTRFIDGAGNGFANRWQHASSILPADRKDLAALGLDPDSGNGDDSMVVEGVVDGTSITVEVSVSWADLGMAGPPMPGQLIGFESQINDRDATTGSDPDSGDPLYASDGKAAWADGANRARLSPSSLGILEFTPPVSPILDYDFTDLTVGEPAAGAGTDDDNWTGPWIEAWRPAWAAVAANGADAIPFVGDLAQSGLGIIGVNAGRLSRTMDTRFDSGIVWTSLVISDDGASTQFWLGDSAKFDLNDSSGLVAGVRMQSGSMQVINTIANRDNKENYVNVGVYPNAPVLAVIMMDYDNSTVGYWIFESGLPIDPANPAAYYEFNLPRNTFLETFSGVAWAGFNGKAVISNLRVGDELAQVLPSAGMEYNCPVLVNALHEPVSVDGDVLDFAWERTDGLVPGNAWMDGGNNVLPADAADLTPVFHTGWNGDMLYIAVIVDDEEVRNSVAAGNRDAVEIYIDGDNSDSAFLDWPTNYDQVDDYQLIFTLNADRTDGADVTGPGFDNPTGNPDGYKGPQGANTGQDFDGITWQAAMTDTGYILEIAMDMTIVPGLDTFLANGMMGFDIAVVDFDDTGLVDELEAPIIEKSQVFFCDDNNWNWNGTAHFGTAYVAGAKPAIAWFGSGMANVPLAGEATAGNGIYEVNTNFSDVAYAIAANQDWVTIDFDPAVGAGEVEFSWTENTGLYQRAAQIEISGAAVLNRIDLTQAGIAPQGLAAYFPSATAGNPGVATTYLGDVAYDGFPWIGTDSIGWLYAMEGSAWLYCVTLGDYLYTSEALWPFVYTSGSGTVSAGWKYIMLTDGLGGYLYDYDAGAYVGGMVFPR